MFIRTLFIAVLGFAIYPFWNHSTAPPVFYYAEVAVVAVGYFYYLFLKLGKLRKYPIRSRLDDEELNDKSE